MGTDTRRSPGTVESMKRKTVVVVGGGFGGINAVRTLSRCRDLDIILIDRRNHHLFQPLLYQVAMAGLSPADIAMPIRSLFSGLRNVRVVMATVEGIDSHNQQVETNVGPFRFDYLILACGMSQSYFGHDQWQAHAPGLKSIEQATEIRRRVLTAFERAESCTDPEAQRADLTFVVVGGGPTGVELAGAIGEISKYTLSRDFRHIDPSRTRIMLIEAGPRILPTFHESLSRRASRALDSLGVQIWTHSRVTDISEKGVLVGDEFMATHTVLWAAGVGPTPLSQKLETEKDRAGRLKVEADLRMIGKEHVFCVGDQAYCADGAGQPLPGLAPVALQQGRHAASNVIRLVKGESTVPFRYFDKGQLATVGRRRAALQFGGVRSFGFFAWLIWLFVHIYYLIGFKNRIFVFWQWMWHYVSYARGARLITDRLDGRQD